MGKLGWSLARVVDRLDWIRSCVFWALGDCGLGTLIFCLLMILCL